MKLARRIFGIAGVYGIGVTLAWQLVFLVIARIV